MKLAPSILALSLLAATPPLPAQTDPSQSFSQQIVVTASGVPETLASTPASVTVITRADIQAQEARDVADVLRDVPGLSVSRSGSDGKATSLFTRGSDSTETLVLWNGVPINNPYFAGFDWGRFSTAGVQRIEVVRGPFSALYGSDAVAGVVNILTDSDASFGSLEAEGGQRGLFNGSFTGATRMGHLSLFGSFERRADDGWFANDDFTQNSEVASGRWNGDAHWSAGFDVRHTTYALGIPFDNDASELDLVPSLLRRQNGSETQISVPLRKTFASGAVELTLSDSRRLDDFNDPDDPFGQTSSTTDSDTRRARLQANDSLGAFGNLIAGAEEEQAKVHDVTNFGVNLDNQTRTNRSLFVEDRYSHQLGSADLEISAGLREDHFDTFGSQLSPRLGAALRAGMVKYHVAYGKAFRAPSLGELYFPFLGNPNLDPERSRSVEAGADLYLAPRSTLSATLFRNDFSNLIVFDNATFLFGNTGRARTEGAEIGLTTPLSSFLTSTVSYTLLNTRQASTGEALLRRPKNSGSLLLDYGGASSFRAAATVIYGGERTDVRPVLPFDTIGDKAYTTVDLLVGYRIHATEPFIKLENATGTKYQEVAGFQAPGRRLVVGVRYDLK